MDMEIRKKVLEIVNLVLDIKSSTDKLVSVEISSSTNQLDVKFWTGNNHIWMNSRDRGNMFVDGCPCVYLDWDNASDGLDNLIYHLNEFQREYEDEQRRY